MKTPVLLSVAKPVTFLGTPPRVLGINMGVFAITAFIVHPVLSLGLMFTLQGLAFMKTRKNPYFDRVWQAYFSCKRTKSILPSKGHRYVGR